MLRDLNGQLLLTFECVNAIGTSLELERMIDVFLRTFIRKTDALGACYWVYDPSTASYRELTYLGKTTLQPLFQTPTLRRENDPQIATQSIEGNKTFLHVKIDNDWMAFLFHATSEEIELFQAIIASFYSRFENAVRACKNHRELLEINQTLERRIEEEVAKNREKDKHILEQSRLAQMGEMISMIAHQWRQPLSSISAVAASIKLKITLGRIEISAINPNEESKLFLMDSMTKIESYVQFLTHTIDDFRNFFKPNKQKESVTLSQLLNRTLEIIGKALEINGITVTTEVHATNEVFTYTNEVTQVILNILKNAEDVIKERDIPNAHIWIHIDNEHEWSTISIEDNAGGIAKNILPRIFEPYFSTKSEKNGSGLGLYMSKTIIEEHCGGIIFAENTEQGARFVIKLREG
jgi:signal transduction histidine kinase